MVRRQSILSLLLAFVAVWIVGCGSPAEFKPPTYTTTQLEQIQQYQSDIQTLRDRLPELATLITKRNWIDARNFIHGPLGELRFKMTTLSRGLLPGEQKQALKTAKDVFDHLVLIDEAAASENYNVAIRNYAEALKDLDAFFQLIPGA